MSRKLLNNHTEIINQLMYRYPLISNQVDKTEIRIILEALAKIIEANIPGDIVEFGCYNGTTSLFIQRFLSSTGSARRLFVYDSFEGLPEKTPEDNSPSGGHFIKGELAVTKASFIRNFKKAGLQLPVVRKAWFDQLNDSDIPKMIAFAFLDGDYYLSIKNPLKLITPHLPPGSAVIVDDYSHEALPGAAIAVDEWIRMHPSAHLKVQSSLAIITT